MSINATLVIDERRAWSPAPDETSVLSAAYFPRGLSTSAADAPPTAATASLPTDASEPVASNASKPRRYPISIVLGAETNRPMSRRSHPPGAHASPPPANLLTLCSRISKALKYCFDFAGSLPRSNVSFRSCTCNLNVTSVSETIRSLATFAPLPYATRRWDR